MRFTWSCLRDVKETPAPLIAAEVLFSLLLDWLSSESEWTVSFTSLAARLFSAEWGCIQGECGRTEGEWDLTGRGLSIDLVCGLSLKNKRQETIYQSLESTDTAKETFVDMCSECIVVV